MALKVKNLKTTLHVGITILALVLSVNYFSKVFMLFGLCILGPQSQHNHGS